jgi:hypothetical protein
MPAEQSGAEASPGPAETGAQEEAKAQQTKAQQTKAQQTKAQQTKAQQSDKPSLEDTAKADLEALKRKFREALERKRGTHGSGNSEGAQDTGKVHGSHGPETSRRSFRRKSGG